MTIHDHTITPPRTRAKRTGAPPRTGTEHTGTPPRTGAERTAVLVRTSLDRMVAFALPRIRRRPLGLLLVPTLALAVFAGVWAGRALSPPPATPAPAAAAPNAPDVALRQQLPHVLGTLNEARLRGRAALARTDTPTGQERAARALARAHEVAAGSLRSVPGAAGAVLADRLGATADAYFDLARAARAGSTTGFASARREVVGAEARVRAALPAPLPRTRPVAATPAGTHGAATSRTILLLVMVLFGLLGAGLAVFRIPARLVGAARAAQPPARDEPAPAGQRARPSRSAAAPQAGTDWLAPSPAAPAAAAAVLTPSAAATRPKRRRSAAAPAGTSKPRRAAQAQAARPGRRPRPEPAPFPPKTGWSCEISWTANLRNAGFRATAAAPGQAPRVIAQSANVSWPPLFPPRPDDDVLAAARALVCQLRDAGWTPVSRGDSWYAQRFVWDREQEPPPLARWPQGKVG